ncbi:MAG: hypothetical protein JW741_22760 [Sedimentisphaerales bacterium]|nr:hypothetical protein [Sedimentisphaerales bacterium]
MSRDYVIGWGREDACRGAAHGTSLGQFVREAEQAGWIALRYELMTGPEHCLSIFVQKGLSGPEP